MVQKYESGEVVPSLEIINEIAEIFKVDATPIVTAGQNRESETNRYEKSFNFKSF